MKEAKQYQPIGRVYLVEFVDGLGLWWKHHVAIPADQDVTVVLEVLEQAYPGRKVRSLKEVLEITHGRIGVQDYSEPN